MKIGVFPADLTGCGHYRLIWPAMTLMDKGYDVTIIPPHERNDAFSAEIDTSTDTVVGVKSPNYDVIVLQRVTHRYLAQAIPLIRKQGKAVVVDIDDDLEAIHPSNPAWVALHPKSRGGSNAEKHSWEYARLACQNATITTVSSTALQHRYSRGGNGMVIRNYVPEEYLTVQRRDSNIIGWGGSLHSHPDDLSVVGTAIARLTRVGVPFKVIGPGTGIRQALRLDHEPEHTGTVPMEDWAEALGTLGIGIAPLTATRFNAAKSWLKPLEMASAGVPSVMSPRAEYVALNKLGIGVLAATPKEWFTALQRFVKNPSYRADMSLLCRDAATRLTVQSNAYRWEEAWTTAFERREYVHRPATVGSAFGIVVS